MDIASTIDEYLASKQNSITHKTYQWYSDFLGMFARWCAEKNLSDLSQITVSHVQQFVSSAKTTNTNTRHHRAQVVKGFLNWCAQDEELGVREKMVRRIEMPKVEQPEISIFSDAEIMRLFRACDKTQNPHRNKAILHILLDTGIRAAELCFDGEGQKKTLACVWNISYLAAQVNRLSVSWAKVAKCER
jgi:integrase/recombinase XerD